MNKENKITWKKDSQAGVCEITGYRTQWIAYSEHGSIRCFANYNPFGISLDAVVWNRILTNKIENLNK